MSVSELARRLAAAGAATAESKRRWLQKVLRDEVDQPDMATVAAALKLPENHFEVPTPDQDRRRRVRLAELEDRLDDLRREFDAFVEAVSERRADLETAHQPATRRSVRPKTGRKDR